MATSLMNTVPETPKFSPRMTRSVVSRVPMDGPSTFLSSVITGDSYVKPTPPLTEPTPLYDMCPSSTLISFIWPSSTISGIVILSCSRSLPSSAPPSIKFV